MLPFKRKHEDPTTSTLSPIDQNTAHIINPLILFLISSFLDDFSVWKLSATSKAIRFGLNNHQTTRNRLHRITQELHNGPSPNGNLFGGGFKCMKELSSNGISTACPIPPMRIHELFFVNNVAITIGNTNELVSIYSFDYETNAVTWTQNFGKTEGFMVWKPVQFVCDPESNYLWLALHQMSIVQSGIKILKLDVATGNILQSGLLPFSDIDQDDFRTLSLNLCGKFVIVQHPSNGSLLFAHQETLQVMKTIPCDTFRQSFPQMDEDDLEMQEWVKNVPLGKIVQWHRPGSVTFAWGFDWCIHMVDVKASCLDGTYKPKKEGELILTKRRNVLGLPIRNLEDHNCVVHFCLYDSIIIVTLSANAYSSSSSSTLLIFDTKSLEPLFELPSSMLPNWFVTPPAVFNGILYFATVPDGTVAEICALDLATMTTNWTISLPASLEGIRVVCVLKQFSEMFEHCVFQGGIMLSPNNQRLFFALNSQIGGESNSLLFQVNMEDGKSEKINLQPCDGTARLHNKTKEQFPSILNYAQFCHGYVFAQQEVGRFYQLVRLQATT